MTSSPAAVGLVAVAVPEPAPLDSAAAHALATFAFRHGITDVDIAVGAVVVGHVAPGLARRACVLVSDVGDGVAAIRGERQVSYSRDRATCVAKVAAPVRGRALQTVCNVRMVAFLALVPAGREPLLLGPVLNHRITLAINRGSGVLYQAPAWRRCP